MTVDAILRAQDWASLRTRLATFAWRRTGKRSWDRANDLAGQAIADAFEHGAWDPQKEPLEKHLVKRVMALASTEMRRKRNTFEVRMIHAPEYENVASNDEPADEVIHRKRVAAMFCERLTASFTKNDDADTVLTLMKEEIVSVEGIAKASGLAIERVRAARRRIFYNAEKISKELARELDAEDDGAQIRGEP